MRKKNANLLCHGGSVFFILCGPFVVTYEARTHQVDGVSACPTRGLTCPI